MHITFQRGPGRAGVRGKTAVRTPCARGSARGHGSRGAPEGAARCRSSTKMEPQKAGGPYAGAGGIHRLHRKYGYLASRCGPWVLKGAHRLTFQARWRGRLRQASPSDEYEETVNKGPRGLLKAVEIAPDAASVTWKLPLWKGDIPMRWMARANPLGFSRRLLLAGGLWTAPNPAAGQAAGVTLKGQTFTLPEGLSDDSR